MTRRVHSRIFELALPAVALACLALGALAPSSASAYCRTTTCHNCERDGKGCLTEGTPIAWPNACVSFSMNEAALSYSDLDTVTALMQQAFATWESVRCPPDGRHPSISVSNSFGPTMCAEATYSPGLGNANIIMFREKSWPYKDAGQTLATTTVKFNQEGVIFDADMEINATPDMPLIVSELDPMPKGYVVGQHDLLSILTHEAGHFLGLDHSKEKDSIMRISLEPGQVLTTLAADDEAAICAIYPPERLTPACDDTPRGGFTPECVDHGSLKGGAWGCSVQPAASSPAQTTGAALFGLGALTMMWRRLRRRRSE